MKKLGELKVGDVIYLIEMSDDTNCILDISSHIVTEICETKYGIIIRWEGGTCPLLTSEFNFEMETAFYCHKICSDREYLLKYIEDEKRQIVARYDRILNELV